MFSAQKKVSNVREKIALRVNKAKEVFLFWRDAGITQRYLSIVVINNLVAKGMSGIGIGLLIPLAQGVIKEDFTLVTNSFLFKKCSTFFPFLDNLGNLNIFIALSTLILALNMARSLVTYRLELYQVRTNLKITSSITRSLFEDQISFGQRFLDETNAGSYASKISRAPRNVASFLDSFTIIVGSTIEVLIYAVVLAVISFKLFFATISIIPIVVVFIFLFRSKIRKLAEVELDRENSIAKNFYNSIIKAPMIKVFDTRLEELAKFDQLFESYEDSKFQAKKLLTFIRPVRDGSVFFALFLLVLVLKFHLNHSANASVASMLVFFFTFRQLLTSAISTVMQILIVPQKLTIIENLRGQFELQKRRHVETGTKIAVDLKEAITCRELSFSYGKNGPTLKGVNCSIPKGKITAIVGRSGSGKSTLVNLLLRLYTPPSQSIFFDDVDITDYSEKSVRQMFSFVSQDILLFDDTFINNICYGLKVPPGKERIFEVLKEVSLIELLEKLPNGLESHLGDRATLLSGGEQQRIAVARALLSDAPIIILDEPTSSVDVEGEFEIIELIRRLAKGKTVVIIAHSLLAIQFADHIVVIEDGKTKEEGSIKELLRFDSDFSRLCKIQMSAENRLKS